LGPSHSFSGGDAAFVTWQSSTAAAQRQVVCGSVQQWQPAVAFDAMRGQEVLSVGCCCITCWQNNNFKYSAVLVESFEE